MTTLGSCKCINYPGSGHCHGNTMPETYGPCPNPATKQVPIHTHYVSGGNPPAPLRGYTDTPMCEPCAMWHSSQEKP